MKPDNIKSTTDIDAIKKYTVPSLVEGVDWYIKFYAYDPAQQKMRRKKIKLNHIEKIGQRRRYADGLMKRLIQKLEDGWNPWIESENEKAYHTFTDTCNHYRKIILKYLNDGVLREDTYRDYISKLKNIEEWNKSRKIPIVYIYQFDRAFISDFLEEIYIGRKNSVQTRNNYLAFIRIFSSFLTEHQYVKIKPSEGIASISKRNQKKIRTTIPDKDIKRLYEYLKTENIHFLLACYIIHYTFVRRKEMSFIKISDISIQKQTLYIKPEYSKNGKGGTVTIPERVIHLMLDLKIFNYPGHYYLFSDKFMPGNKHKHEKQFTDYWANTVRKKIGFPVSYQFYSLKDTGITSMLRQYDVLTVRDQARHSTIDMTDKYTPHDIQEANKIIAKHEGIL